MTQGVEMLPVDWSQPVEAVHTDGRVCAAIWTGDETVWRADGHAWHSSSLDGTTGFDGWTIRNVASHTHPAATGSVREALEKVQEFLREPDHAEHFGTGQLLEWINRRPTHIIPKLLAAAPTPDAPASEAGEVERIARAMCEADGMDPDEDIVGGQASGFENYGALWQAEERSEGQLGLTNYARLARAARAALTTQGGAEG